MQQMSIVKNGEALAAFDVWDDMDTMAELYRVLRYRKFDPGDVFTVTRGEAGTFSISGAELLKED